MTIPNVSDENKATLKSIIMNSITDLSVCDKEGMEEKLSRAGLDPNLYTLLIQNLSRVQMTAKEGILDLTPEKVRAYYNHLFVPSNRYDRVTVDNAGKYSGFVGIDGKTFTPHNMDRIVDFCEAHNMETKINTTLFYNDFPKLYEAYLESRVQRGEITEEQKKEAIKDSLMRYAEEISSRYSGRVQTLDIFNELIYDGEMLEEPEYFTEEPTYHYRTKGWQKYLDLEDLCEMALICRNNMPDATFVYNEMHLTVPEKRFAIIQMAKQIKKIEERYRKEGKLFPGDGGIIDVIGLEGHLFTSDSLDEIRKVFDDIARETGLPMEISELDVARNGDNPLSESEIRKQKMIFELINEMAKRPDVVALTSWSQSDDLSFMNVKCGRKVYPSVLDSDFQEKEFEKSQELSKQDFNFHTHTSLCGHAEGQMEEYVQKAIESGFSILGFSDHSPSPTGDRNPHSQMSMTDFEEKYIPTLEALREKYRGQIDIKFGLEEEYLGDEVEEDPVMKKYRDETTPHLDYLILGQHFALARDELGGLIKPYRKADHKSAHYPLDYAMTVVEAIRSGKYALVAHPDLFLQARDSITPEERDTYEENVRIATEMICSEAAKHHIPLEVNLGGIGAVRKGIRKLNEDGTYPYPVPYFWQVAQEKGCDVLIGFDAHSPSYLLARDVETEIQEYLKNYGVDLKYMKEFMPKGIGREGDMGISKQELREGLEEELKDSEEIDATNKEMSRQMEGPTITKEEEGKAHEWKP